MRTLFLFLAVYCVISVNAIAQEYERFPSFPFQISVIDWNLVVEPTLDGFSSTATYQLRSNRDGVQTIALAQRDLIIASVKQDGEELPFILTADSVRITLRNPIGRGADFKVSIDYSAYPTYGFFIDPSVLIWTSGLHGVVPGLLPVLEHPRVKFRTDVTVTHPAVIQVVTNGGYVSRTVLNVNEARTVFRSRAPISASSLRLAFGMMQSSESRVGTTPVRMYVGDNTRVTDGGRSLLNMAVAEIQRVSSRLKSPFPFDGMNVLVAPSSYGETWGDGAGFAVLFDDLGDLESQLKIAIASQWLRHSVQGLEQETWYPMAAYTRRLAGVNNVSIDLTVATMAGNHRPTDLNSILVHASSNSDTTAYPLSDLDYFARFMPGLIWQHDLEEIRFASGWVRNPLPPSPVFERQQPQVSRSVSSGGFILRFDRTENPEKISLVIDPYGNPERKEYVMTLREVYLDDSITQTVRFGESGGEVSLDVANGLLNVLPTMDDATVIQVEKPLGYWLHQYRNASERSDKVDAARALGAYAGDPDLGLLIRELERNELDAAVKASVMLGMLESGVEEMTSATIVSLLDSPDAEVRTAVLRMIDRQVEPIVDADYLLALYAEADVTAEERRLIAKQLSKLMSTDDFNQFVQSESKKPEGKELLSVTLQAYFDEGSIDAGIDFAEVLIGREHPFGVRREALRLLEVHDTNTQRWSIRLPRLASDQDPRVRMMALDLANKLDADQARILLQDRIAKEVDPRIRARFESIRR